MTDVSEFATFSLADGKDPTLRVKFNPASLKLTVTNKLQDEESGASKATDTSKNKKGPAQQNTHATTTKLDTELTFDTTETGADVRGGDDGTNILRQLASTPKGDNPTPPQVKFRWGRFSFIGVIESLNETLDFWSAEGVPLRATVQLSMQETEHVPFEDGGRAALPPARQQAINKAPQGGRGTTDVAARNGNAGAGRAVAAANGIENMRMVAGGAAVVSASVQIRAAATFSISAGASAGAGLGIGASAGAGASAGFGIGASAGAGASAGIGTGAGASAGFGASAGASAGFGAGAGFGAAAGASAGAGFGAAAGAGFGATAGAGTSTGFSAGASAGASARFGASATAGTTASSGAFAALGPSKTTSVSLPFDPAQLLPRPSAPVVGSGARFDVTGKAISGGSSGLSANVTGKASGSVNFW